MAIEWSPDVHLDVLFLIIVNTTTKEIVSLFLNPSIGHIQSSLDFSSMYMSYDIFIYGLVTIENNRGRFYKLRCCTQLSLTNSIGNTNTEVAISCRLKDPDCESLSAFNEISKETSAFRIERRVPSTYTIIADYCDRKLHTYIVFVKQKGTIYIFTITSDVLRLTLQADLLSGTWTEVVAMCCRQENNEHNRCMTCSTIWCAKTSFKTYLSMDDYKRLNKQAEDHLSQSEAKTQKPILYFYRNKSGKYYHDILASPTGEMIPYLKDHNGDQGSVINGNMNGLFFSAFLGPKSKPPPISYYGPLRLHLQANLLFKETCNIYFADFYCHYKTHYVTVVLTPQGTDEDQFCRSHLLELDKFNNPYIKIRKIAGDIIDVMVTMGVIVEIFYTDSVSVRDFLQRGFGFLSKSICMGRGETKPLGIPKKTDCGICNF